MKDIATILYSFGFLDSEVKTYLASLEYGPKTVLELTKLTHLSRQATYVVIESLTKRGLMSSVLRGKKRYYVAEDPEKLHSYAQRREQDIKEKMKDLERAIPEMKLKMGGEKPAVRLFEGIEGLKTIISDLADMKPDVVMEITDLEALFKVIKPEDTAAILKDLKKVNTKVDGIYSGAPTGKTLQSTRHFLPKELGGFKSGITVYKNRVAITTFEGKMYSVMIENETIAKVFKILFELAIRGSKDFPTD